MTEKIKRDVLEALAADDLNKAVNRLKTGLKREPYWEWGHRTLGDIYMEGLEHAAYALVQYRKLEEVKDSLTPAEKLRLAWAYEQRDFMDKASDVLGDLRADELPSQIDLLGVKYDARELYDRFSESSTETLEKNNEKFFEKYRRNGDEHRKHGNFFDAQQAYEKALEFEQNPEVRLDLARCLIQRSKYPEALEHLKELQGTKPLASEVEELTTEVYDRLGLNELFDLESDDDDQPGQSRKVS